MSAKQAKELHFLGVLLFVFFCPTSLFSQKNIEKTYFQQAVAYNIRVTLDDTKHTLQGNIAIRYTNHSPDTLPFLYFHLWQNAYKNNSTALVRQQVFNQRQTKLYFAADSARGYVDGLHFKANGAAVTWQYDPENADIAILQLPKPLLPAETIEIETPFFVKIPASFSRLGHVGDSYQITQWYPKPAVYDREGWHPMPYLDAGEFYSEFGSFDVSITLPENYVVGATGTLQTASEKNFLQERVAATNQRIADGTIAAQTPAPPSAKTLKTIRYTAENVHDFAWFADKRFFVQQSGVTLPSGETVTTWAMFTHQEADLWTKAVDYVNRAVAFYSDRVGAYPYPQATAVQSALSAGAGMEYPMITVIGLSSEALLLDEVITHEVGHNWFYGILGSNERSDAWMDEGFNTFYEMAYMNQHYQRQPTLGTFSDNLGPFKRVLDAESANLPVGYAAYLYQARRGEQQPVATSSELLSQTNYGINAYFYTAFLLEYLENYLGTPTFDAMMKNYYQTWKFKHPLASDLKAFFEDYTQKNLDWWFDDLLNTNKRLDYAIQSVQTLGDSSVIIIKNNQQIPAPFSIAAFVDKKQVQKYWLEGFDGTKSFKLKGKYDEYIIDADHQTPDYCPQNNRFRTDALFAKVEPLAVKWFAGIESSSKTAVYLTPLAAFNAYDGLLLGLHVANNFFPAKPLEVGFAPLWAVGSQRLAGTASLFYHFIPQKTTALQRTTVGLAARSFEYDSFERADGSTATKGYWRLEPSAAWFFKSNRNDQRAAVLRVRGVFISEEAFQFANDGTYLGNTNAERVAAEVRYRFADGRPVQPYSVEVSFLAEDYPHAVLDRVRYGRLTVTGKYAFPYRDQVSKRLDVRLFAGKFLFHNAPDFGASPLALMGYGKTDYFYDGLYFGRTEQDGLWSRQIDPDLGGGFKTPFYRASGGGGLSNDWLAALNLKAALPFGKRNPLKPFADFGFFKETAPAADAANGFFFSGGLMLDFGNIFGVYLPLVGNDAVMNPYNEGKNLVERLSFSLQLNALNPRELLKRNIF